MSDSIPTPDPQPEPEPQNGKRSRGVLNKEHEAALSAAEKVAAAATKYLADLTPREISPEKIAALLTLCTTARDSAATAVGSTHTKLDRARLEAEPGRIAEP